MTMQLEGNLVLERAHTRRWVSIIAVVIPVAAFVLVAAWFIRVYIVPPTVTIWNPMIMAAAPPEPPAPAAPAPVEAPQPPMAMTEPVASRSARERTPPAAATPMFTTLAAVPPVLNSPPSAFADPAPDVSTAASPSAIPEPAALEASEPIAGPIPLPRTKPSGPVALLTNAVPLPRPRPASDAPPPDLPAIDRHRAE